MKHSDKRKNLTTDDERTKTSSSSLVQSGRITSSRKSERRAIDFVTLKKSITILQVLKLVDWRPAKQKGAQLRGCCPVHDGKSPRSFSVNTDRNIFRCVKPTCDAKGNALDLWMLLSSESNVARAAVDLCTKLGIDVPRQ